MLRRAALFAAITACALAVSYIPPGEDGNGCVDMQCEDGMVCVQGQSGSKCMSKDPGNNCETTRCYAGSVCEYTETECLQDQACFAEPVCKRAGPREPPPEENSSIVDNNYGPGVQQDLPKGGDSASPQCAGRRNERYYQCKPCESTCVDWVMKRSPSCPNQKCVPGCACIPNWHRKNQPGQFSGTCVRPTWCNPITVTKTVTKVVQPTNTVPGPPAPTTCANVQCAAGSTCVMEAGRPVCKPGTTNPCATTVCNYGSTCQNQGGKAVCVRSQPPAGPSYPPSQPSPPSPRPGPSPPSYQPSGPSAPARPPAYGSGPGPTPPRPVNIGVPGVPVIPTGPFNPGGPVVPNPGYRPSATVQADASRAGPTRCPANEVLTQCGGCEKQCQAGNPPKPVPICTSPRPCVRQCKCRPGFARINKVCTKENLCQTNYRPPLTEKTKTVVKTLPPKTVPGSPSPNQNPCASATCETGSTCQNVDGKAVCVAPPANPCANVVCEDGKACQVSDGKGVCTASGGTPSYPAGDCNPPCGPGLACRSGICYNANRLSDDPTGAAQQPCTAKCSANQRCVLKSDDNSCYNPPCPGVPTCVNVIAPQPSPVPVGRQCTKQCPYGQMCKVTVVQCIRAPCPPIQECVRASMADDTSRKIITDPCATVRCTATTRCVAQGGRAGCVPIAGSQCKKQCPYGQVCRLTQVQCFAAPCPPLEECVPGPANDAYIRKQVTPCTLRCPIGQKCVIQQVQCVRAPCPPQQRCVPMSMADGYYNPHSVPTLTCANVLCAPDTPRCVESPSGPKCVAVKSCAQLKCAKGQRCEQPEKFKDATCVTDTKGPATSTTSYVAKPSPPTRPIACNLFCIRGKRCVVTSSGPKCLPSPTCEELKCPVGQVCKQDNENYAASCARVQSDNPLGVCTPNSCPPNQKCIIQTQQNTICIPTLTCATLRCGPGTKCYPGDSSNDAQCVPYSTCSNTPCDSNSRCVEGGGRADAQCVPIAVCTTPCLSGTICRKGNCVTSCAQTQCGSGQKCSQTDNGASCVASRTCAALTCFAGFKCQEGGPGRDARCVANVGGFVGRNAASFDAPRPCTLACAIGTTCVVTPSGPSCVRVRSCGETTCARKMKCLQNSPTQDAICIPTATCELLDCTSGYQCIAGGDNEDAQCIPFDTCDTLLCPPNMRCLDGGGLSNARCVAAPGCAQTCVGGTRCVKGTCVTTCQVVRCAGGQRCVETETGAQCSQTRSCDTMNCYIGTRCIEASGGADAYCAPVRDRVNPRFQSDTNGGSSNFLPPGEEERIQIECREINCGNGRVCQDFMQKATCVIDERKSCKNLCQPGMICVLQKVFCYAPPCYPRAACIRDPYFHNGSPLPTPPPQDAARKPLKPEDCGKNEMLSGCGALCEGKCENVGKGPVACPFVCLPPACACKENFYRDSKGNCVTAAQCSTSATYPSSAPKDTMTSYGDEPNTAVQSNAASVAAPTSSGSCPYNEVLNQCGNRCEPTCANVDGRPMVCPRICGPPACVCAAGLFRRNGVCVTKQQCLAPPQDAIRKPVKPEVTAVQSTALVAAPTSSGNCPYNEVLNQCGNRCEPTCANANGQPKICPRICDPPACVCAAGLFRRNGVCVTKQQCLGPPQDAIRRPVKPEDCGNNEMLNVCGAICEGKCENVGKGPVVCPFVCLPAACACKENFYRDSNGKCVTASQCSAYSSKQSDAVIRRPTPPGSCPYNEMLNQCGNRCEPTCANVDGKPRVCLAICDPPACVCATGLFRRNGVCVTKQQCLAPPQDAIRKPVKPEDCGNNEMLSGCGALCEGKCENAGKGPVACPLICLPPACACKENFYRDSKGNCVTASQCSTYSSKQSDALVAAPTSSGSCASNEVLNQCGNRCEPTCANVDGKPRVCPAICDPPACVCAAGLFRRNGMCVTKQQCLGGSTNVRRGRREADKDTMTSYGDEPEVPFDLCSSFICLKEEICVQDEGGARCELNIPECGENEQVDNCGNRCEPTCENAYGQVKVCLLICDPPACVCKPNYYRKDGKCVPQRDCPPPKTKPKSYVDEPFTPPSSSPKPTTKSYVDEPITPPPTASTPKKNNYVDEPITPPPVYGKTSSRSYVDEPITPPPVYGKTSERSYVDEPITPKPDKGKNYVDEPITRGVFVYGMGDYGEGAKQGNGKTYVDEPITPKPTNGKNYVVGPQTQCSANETLSGCGNLCEGKCVNLGKGPIACPAICGPPACACKESYYRNSAGLCVTAKDCPLVCGPNEEINMCGNLCEPGCENAFGNPKVCIEICNPPACVCKPNFYRKNGKCITKNLCFPPASGNVNVNVNKNTYVDEPITPSPTGNGNKKNYVDEPITPSPKGNGNKKNYVDGPITPASGGKSHQNSYVDEPIIPSTNGKVSANSYVEKPKTRCSMNETLAECGKICEAKCENLGKGPIVCPAVCEPPSCACKNGYYRNMDGKCVAEIDCPFNCGQNEQLNPCGSRCEPTCENAFGKPKACVKICDPPACVCKPDYYRKDGKCVPQMGCGVPSASATKVDTMTSYVDEPLVPSKEGSSCADTDCEEGMVCVEGDIQAKCVAKDPADNCETKKCPSGEMCEYREVECIPDKACFAEAVCTGDGNTGSTPGPTGSTKTYVDEPETGGPEPNPCFNFKCPNGQECSLQSGEAKCVSKMMKCGENEKMNQCGKHCENHCTNAGKGPIQCKAPCTKPACVCDDGYYRNSLGKCVLERLCSLTCHPNEHANPCGDLCEKSCDEKLNMEKELPCIEVCAPPACVCNDGYLRLNRGGPCVPTNACPIPPLPPGQIGGNGNSYKNRRLHL